MLATGSRGGPSKANENGRGPRCRKAALSPGAPAGTDVHCARRRPVKVELRALGGDGGLDGVGLAGAAEWVAYVEVHAHGAVAKKGYGRVAGAMGTGLLGESAFSPCVWGGMYVTVGVCI